MNRTNKLLVLSFLSTLATPGAFAAFDTLAIFGDAAGTTPAASFTGDGSSNTVINAGGADFWGTSDVGGAMLYDSTGTFTATGDFTATVRHVSTTEPAPEWGRDGIYVKADAGGAVPGAPEANDPTFASFRKSNGQIREALRAVRGTDYAEIGGFNGPSVATTSYYFAAARQDSTMHSSAALNLGTQAAPVVGRWVETGTSTAVAFAGGTSLIVGLGHQSHYQTGGGATTGGVNTATFDSWNYSGSYNAARFGPAAGAGANPWSIAGALSVNPNGGAITGRSFVQVGGVATGESNKWTIRAVDPNSLAPAFGAANAVKSITAMEVADIVPSSQFRRSAVLPGLTADIYLHDNAGTLFGNRNTINAGPIAGTAVIPNINWTGGNNSDTNYNGLTGPSSFGVAVQGVDPASSTAGAFSDNQEQYGVHMTGQIFIESDANRKGQYANVVLFKDGIDDYTYLNVDGQAILNDNDWTGYNSVDNGGGHVGAMDVSDPKFDDGEWVPFEMIMWEGGGGDAGVLYTDQNDTNGTFVGLAPLAASNVINMTGSNQVGNETTDGAFGSLPNGTWDVTLTVENTGTSATFTQSLTVVPEPTSALLVGLTGIGLILRRRRNR